MKVTRNELALFVFWRGELSSPEEAVVVLSRDGASGDNYRLVLEDGKDAILLKDGIPVEDDVEVELELDYREELLLRECQQTLQDALQEECQQFARSIPAVTDGHKYVSRFGGGGMTLVLETYPA